MDAFTVEPTFHKGLLVAQPVRGYRFSMDSVLLPHLIEGRFVTAVELVLAVASWHFNFSLMVNHATAFSGIQSTAI